MCEKQTVIYGVSDGKDAMVKVWYSAHRFMHLLDWRFAQGFLVVHTCIFPPGFKAFSGSVVFLSFKRIFFFLFNVHLKTEVRKTSTLSLNLLIKQKKEHGDGFHNVNATVSWGRRMGPLGAWDKISSLPCGHECSTKEATFWWKHVLALVSENL